MADYKWADVHHYYPILWDEDSGGMDEWWEDKETPRLRHRDDITEAEARELYAPSETSLKELLGDQYEPPKSYKAELFREITHNGTWAIMDHMLGNPRDWHKLLQWGIDLFGLIESGQAIRKEKQNG